MKKALSVILAVLLLCTCLPAGALAEGHEETDPVTEEVAPAEDVADIAPADEQGVSASDAPVEQNTELEADADTVSEGSDAGADDSAPEELTVAPEPEVVTGTLDDLPDSDTLFAQYVDVAFGIRDGAPVRLRKAAALSGQDALLYDYLEAQIAAVAAGNLDSTEFRVPLSVLGVKSYYTPADLGVSSITEEVVRSIITVNIQSVLAHLRVSKAYELYWFDKTSGYGSSTPIPGYLPGTYGYVRFSDDACVVIKMFVSADYSATGGKGTCDVDTARTSAASNAAVTAASVVDQYRNLSDYEKLVAYKEWICGQVDYNFTAAQTSGYPYGDPWQLIYVFDGDESTKVVCEGYSKAFQYLCDQTSWRGNVSCISVSGTMNGGGHMWNIVTIGGKNYMADVTNSDEGSVGWNGQLFLTGYSSGSVADGYVFSWDSYQVGDIFYCYDSDTTALYDEELALSADDYVDTPTAWPVTGSCGDNLTWTLDEDGALTISGTGDMWDYPQPWSNYADDIKTVVVESGVTGISDQAFSYCASLTKATIADGVTDIGWDVFIGCASLTEVRLPADLTYISDGLFCDCAALTEITIPAGVTVINGWAFSGTGLTEIDIPAGAEQIGEGAFSDCADLARVTIPDSVTWIGPNAFDSCASLTEITLPKELTSIGYGTFSGCASLEESKIPDSVEFIGEEAFENCASLTSITLPDNLKSIGPNAFTNAGLTSIEIPDGVESIGSWAFSSCEHLAAVTLPQDLWSIEVGTFAYCGALADITIPDSVTLIADNAFSGCAGLKSVTIPESVTSIDHAAFSGCESLADVYYAGTADQWNAVAIADGNDPLMNATLHTVVVSDTLAGTATATAAEIEAALKAEASNAGYNNTKPLEVTWGGEIPAKGLTVILPCPDGSDPQADAFLVFHMLADGTIETLTPVKTDNGLTVTVYSLASFAVAWKSGTSRLPGDVTGDKKVDIFDLIRLRKYLARMEVEINEKNADVTGDNKVDIFDLIRLRKYLAKFDVTLV